MGVEEADMSYKKQKEVPQGEQAQKLSRSRKDVEKIKRITNEMNARLADWDDDDPQVMPDNVKPASKWDKCVIVKKLFTIEEIEVRLPSSIPQTQTHN